MPTLTIQSMRFSRLASAATAPYVRDLHHEIRHTPRRTRLAEAAAHIGERLHHLTPCRAGRIEQRLECVGHRLRLHRLLDEFRHHCPLGDPVYQTDMRNIYQELC